MYRAGLGGDWALDLSYPSVASGLHDTGPPGPLIVLMNVSLAEMVMKRRRYVVPTTICVLSGVLVPLTNVSGPVPFRV